jgi:sigma-E factor negative regulatory protein RseB
MAVDGSLAFMSLLLRRRPGMARWCAWMLPMVACAAMAAPAAAEQAQDPRAWLLRTHEAAATRNYTGTLVVSAAGSVSSSRVAHFGDGKEQYERVEALDGEPRSMWRHNDLVQTLWPRARLAVVEQRDPRAGFPALFSGNERRVLEWYELKALGTDRVAGHDVDVVLLKARDGARFSQRLWADRQTGLLMRSDIMAVNGQMLESTAFSELTLGVKSQADQVLNGLRRLDGYRVLRPAVLPTSLDAEGWQLGSAIPPGFSEVHCARRSLDPAGGSAAPIVLQAIYSDGLTHVSLFIEPFVPQRHQGEVSAAIGATHTLMLRRDENWLTVVGDVPLETLKRFAVALERKR